MCNWLDFSYKGCCFFFLVLNEPCTKATECFVEKDPENVECRNSVCQCKFGYQASTEQRQCIRVMPNKKSKIPTANLYNLLCILITYTYYRTLLYCAGQAIFFYISFYFSKMWTFRIFHPFLNPENFNITHIDIWNYQIDRINKQKVQSTFFDFFLSWVEMHSLAMVLDLRGFTCTNC